MLRTGLAAACLSIASGGYTGCFGSTHTCRANKVPPLPHDDARLKKAWDAFGNELPAEQVHIMGGSPTKVSIVYAGPNVSELSSSVEFCVRRLDKCAENEIEHVHANGPTIYTSFTDDKHHPCGGDPAYSNISCFYESPPFFTAPLVNLKSDTQYLYRISGEQAWRRFKTPPGVQKPIDFAVVADLGQSNYTAQTVQLMSDLLDEDGFDALLVPGDLSYADGLGPAWDTFGRLMEPLLSRVPALYAGGNHEVAKGMENWIHFDNRYPLFVDDSQSSSNHWYSIDAGLAHVITLCSYCPFAPGSAQYEWLKRDLQNYDRKKQPWLVGQWHVPWYTSSCDHKMVEGQGMRLSMEKMLNEAGLDIALAGHNHAYERTYPMVSNKTDNCTGAVHITVGDGGNQEGVDDIFWACPERPCPPLYGQPDWSAYRDASFGFGRLRIIDDTHAEWQWIKNVNGIHMIEDHYDMLRREGADLPACTGRSMIV